MNQRPYYLLNQKCYLLIYYPQEKKTFLGATSHHIPLKRTLLNTGVLLRELMSLLLLQDILMSLNTTYQHYF